MKTNPVQAAKLQKDLRVKNIARLAQAKEQKALQAAQSGSAKDQAAARLADVRHEAAVLQDNFLLQNKLMLGDDGKKIFNEVLAPIKESIKEYEKGLQEHSKQLVSNKATIQTQIENMFKFSQKIGEEADKLAKILKGDKKARGIFGELQKAC